MLSKQSSYKEGQVTIGLKFDQDGRKWDVTILNYKSFVAKTVDGLKPHLTASFSYKK